jgi:hypothetical protein
MSASTRTIQRPASHGSPLAAVAIGTAALLAVGAVAWGALNLTAAKHVATPVPAPIVLDKGSRGEIAPQAAPAPHPHGRPAYETPRVDPNADNGDVITPAKPGNATPRFATGQLSVSFLPDSRGPVAAQAAPSLVGGQYLSAAAAAAVANGAPASILDGNVVVTRGSGPSARHR